MVVNYFKFEPVEPIVDLTLYTHKHEKVYPETVYADECPDLWEQHPELTQNQYLYFSLIHPEECMGRKYSVQIDVNEHKRIGKHIISQQLYNYFRQSQIVSFDKIDNVEVWVKNEENKKEGNKNSSVIEYLRFSLIPQYSVFNDGWEMLIAFNGVSSVYNEPMSSLDLQASHFQVVVNGEVVKHDRLTPDQKQNIDQAYPKLNRELLSELHLTEKRFRNIDKYNNTYNRIKNFVSTYLLNHDFQKHFKLSADMYSVTEDRIFKVPDGANLLQFKDGKTGIDPYSCVFGSRYMEPIGIYKPTTKPLVKFFFIAQESDKSLCKQLYEVFRFGYKPFVDTATGEQKYSFPSLATCIKQPFDTDNNGSVYFSNISSAYSEISAKLKNKIIDSKTQYVAIFISPVSHDDVNNPYHNLYYKLKELLLNMSITSQVIYRNNLSASNFLYHLPNIATAILAKVGGIPWQLANRSQSNDLIIGVGAFRSEKLGKRYVGSAFCFNQNGLFKNFDCCRDNEIERIVQGIRKAIGHFVVDSDTPPQRLIIHYYKTMGKRESKPISEMLDTLALNIPVIVVTINKTETSDVVMFDESQFGLMPMSGTILKLRHNDYLLYNNSRYRANEKCDLLFPIRVRLSKMVQNHHDELPLTEVNDMLNKVYQFSRMYWKSVKQQNLPITIKYPEMLAEIVPHFSEAEMPVFGKNNLWFL